MKRPYFDHIPVEQIFLETHKHRLYVLDKANPGGRLVDHPADYRGYQRNPWDRLNWIKDRVERYKERLLRPLDVAKRGPNSYAGIDGGGRWLIAQLKGLKTVPCIIHEGLTREEEAALFDDYDKEKCNLRSIDHFLARLSAGDKIATKIAEAIAPYKADRKGAGTLKCVGAFQEVFVSFNSYLFGLKCISRTAKAIAGPWSGYDSKKNEWASKGQIDGKFFAAVAIVIECAGKTYSHEAMVRALGTAPLRPSKLEAVILAAHPDAKTKASTVLYAKRIATAYNRATNFAASIKATDIDNSEIVDEMFDRQTFASRMREAVVRFDPQLVE